MIPVNAIIGFLKRDRRWPSPLYKLGYRLEMIEQVVSVASLGRAEVDVISLSHKRNHAVLWECKSGRTLDERQARVYAAATAEAVQRTGNVTFPNPESATVESAYCCLEPDGEAVVRGLSSCASKIPVVSLGREARLVHSKFEDNDLNRCFTAGVPLPPLDEVPRFLVANTHTSKADLARVVIPTLIGFLQRQTGKFSVGQVMGNTFPDLACMGTDLRRSLAEKVKDIVKELCKYEFQDFAKTSRQSNVPGEIVVEFTVDILGQDASGRTRMYQKLARHAQGYIQRTAENRPFEPTREPESGWLPGIGPEQ